MRAVNAVYSGEVLVINSSGDGITDENCVGGVHKNVDLSLVAFLFWCSDGTGGDDEGESGVIYGVGDPSDVVNVGLGNGGSIVGSF